MTGQVPLATAMAPSLRTADVVVLTRFNLPTPGLESLVRAQDSWLRNRVELFERYCVPSVVAQTRHDLTWLVYLDPLSPPWLLERLRPLVQAGTFVPLYREGVGPSELLADLADAVPHPHADDVITINLDNDDALATNFVERVRRVPTPRGSAVIYFADGLVLSTPRLYLRRDPHNAFRAVRSPWTAPRTCWADWHTMLERHMPAVVVDGEPAWLQVVHGQNVSNRVRGRRVAATDHRDRFVAGALDGVVPLTARDHVRDLLLARPGRSVRDAARQAVKTVALAVVGKDGLERTKHRWARLRDRVRVRNRAARTHDLAQP